MGTPKFYNFHEKKMPNINTTFVNFSLIIIVVQYTNFGFKDELHFSDFTGPKASISVHKIIGLRVLVSWL